MFKKTSKHIILVNFTYRRRIVEGPRDMRDELVDEDPELVKSMEPEPFSTILRKVGLLPPDFDLPEYEEENLRREYDDAQKDPNVKFTDHKDDKTTFEICIINKRNEALIIDCNVF